MHISLVLLGLTGLNITNKIPLL